MPVRSRGASARPRENHAGCSTRLGGQVRAGQSGGSPTVTGAPTPLVRAACLIAKVHWGAGLADQGHWAQTDAPQMSLLDLKMPLAVWCALPQGDPTCFTFKGFWVC